MIDQQVPNKTPEGESGVDEVAVFNTGCNMSKLFPKALIIFGERETGFKRPTLFGFEEYCSRDCIPIDISQ